MTHTKTSLVRKSCLLIMAYCLAQAAYTLAEQPRIDSVDPPQWWVQLPDPMLLVHGSGFSDSRFSIHGKGVTLQKAQISPNGHWAFLWIKTAGVAPQTLEIGARGKEGSTTAAYRLQARNEAPPAHLGISGQDVIYLVMTDRFADGNPTNDQPGYDLAKPRGWHGGDFAGIEKHLDYLKSLGITALWTTPVYDNGAMPESYHGYAATNLYAVDPHFGTLQDYQHLSDTLHSHGMKLIIDLVPNHIGVQHPWIKDPPTPDWFHGTLADHTISQGDFNTLIDPHATPGSSRQLTQGWFTDSMPDMNQENPLVSEYLIQNAIWWVETARVDAIRIDTFPYVGRAFWHDFHAALHLAYPNLTTVGEIFNGDPVVTSYFAGGREHLGIDTGLDTPFDFPVYFSVRNVLAHGKPMTDLAAILRQDSLYPHPERLIHFFGNHDTTRFLTEANGSLPRLKEALGLMATLRGTPELYSGDEIAMLGGEDPDNRRDFPGGFPANSTPGAASGFSAETRTPDQQTSFLWTSALLAARHTHPVLQTGIQQDLWADDTAFVYLRTSTSEGCVSAQSNEKILAVVNKDTKPRTLTVPISDTALAGCTEWKALAPADSGQAELVKGALQITVPQDSFAFFVVR